KSSRSGHTVALQPRILQDLKGIGEVCTQFIGRFRLTPFPVFHKLTGRVRVTKTGFDIDYARMTDHFRMDIPIGLGRFPNQPDAFFELFRGPAGNKSIEPSRARRIRYHAVLSLYPAIITPGQEF